MIDTLGRDTLGRYTDGRDTLSCDTLGLCVVGESVARDVSPGRYVIGDRAVVGRYDGVGIVAYDVCICVASAVTAFRKFMPRQALSGTFLKSLNRSSCMMAACLRLRWDGTKGNLIMKVQSSLGKSTSKKKNPVKMKGARSDILNSPKHRSPNSVPTAFLNP